jgi:hypothetical protein
MTYFLEQLLSLLGFYLNLFFAFRYRQSAEQQEATRHYYLQKAEDKRLADELKKQQQLAKSPVN